MSKLKLSVFPNFLHSSDTLVDFFCPHLGVQIGAARQAAEIYDGHA